MADKKYNILKAASWYTIGNILIKGVSFFVLPIFTSLMSTTDYGIYSIYVSYLTIFEVLMLLGMSSTVRIAKFTKDMDFNKYMSTILIIPPVLTVLSAIVVNIYMIFNNELLSMSLTLWNFLFISAATVSVSNIICARLVIDGSYKTYMIYSMMTVLSNVGISLLLFHTAFAKQDVYMARVWGNLLSNVLSMGYLIFATKIKWRFNVDYLKIGLRWGVPLLFHTLATVVLTQSDRIIIKYIEGYSVTGIYSIAVTIIAIPMVIQSSFESAWAPWFYDKLDKKDYLSIRKLNDKYILLFVAIIAEFILVCPEIIRIFTNKAYWNSMYSLIPLSISVFGEMLYSLPVNIEYYNKKTNFILTGTIFVASLNIVLDIIFVYTWGYIGAAYATTISKLLLFVFHWIFAKKVDSNDIFSKRVVIGSIVGLTCLNCFTVFTVNMIGFRIIAFVVIGILFVYSVLKNKDLLKSFLKK